MKSLAEQEGKPECVFLVGAELKQGNTFDVNESMEELSELATTAGATIIGAIALMALFLIVRAIPSLQANQANFLLSTEFLTTDSDNLRFGIRDLFS